jgi:hypothetical protein
VPEPAALRRHKNTALPNRVAVARPSRNGIKSSLGAVIDRRPPICLRASPDCHAISAGFDPGPSKPNWPTHSAFEGRHDQDQASGAISRGADGGEDGRADRDADFAVGPAGAGRRGKRSWSPTGTATVRYPKPSRSIWVVGFWRSRRRPDAWTMRPVTGSMRCGEAWRITARAASPP